MWLLNFLPDFVFHLLLIIGVLGIVAGFFLSNIPFINTNGKLIQVVSILITVLAVWYEGGIAKDQEYKKQIAELQLKVAKAETESANANAKLTEELLKHQQAIQQITAANKQRLNNQAADLNKACTVNDNVISILNDAAKARGGAK
ncbi:MAG: hypothetical protein WCO84_06460 [bacterium]